MSNKARLPVSKERKIQGKEGNLLKKVGPPFFPPNKKNLERQFWGGGVPHTSEKGGPRKAHCEPLTPANTKTGVAGGGKGDASTTTGLGQRSWEKNEKTI